MKKDERDRVGVTYEEEGEFDALLEGDERAELGPDNLVAPRCHEPRPVKCGFWRQLTV